MNVRTILLIPFNHRLCSDVTSFPQMLFLFFCSQIKSIWYQSKCFSRLYQSMMVLWTFWLFMSLTLVKNTVISDIPYFGLDCYFLISTFRSFWVTIPQKDGVISVHIRGSMIQMCAVTGAVSIKHSVKILSARFLHCKVIIFPFLIDKLLEGDTLRQCR